MIQAANLQTEHYNQTLNTMLNLHLLVPYQQKFVSIPKVSMPDPPAHIIKAWQDHP